MGAPCFYIKWIAGLEGSGVNDCQWQSEPTTAPPAGGQVLLGAPRRNKFCLFRFFCIKKALVRALFTELFQQQRAYFHGSLLPS